MAPAGLLLVAPVSVAPGATLNLQLFDIDASGAARDVTGQATFGGGPREVVTVSPTGAVTGVGIGEASVHASYQMRNALRQIVVVPDGTFRVLGQVVEQGTSVPVGAVRVEADGGPAALTGFDGRYRLFGVPGGSRLRFSKPGYLTTEVALDLTSHHVQDVGLVAGAPRLDFGGAYEMVIEAAAVCRGRLPDALLTRRYTAAVTQVDRELRLVLSGADVVPLNPVWGEPPPIAGHVAAPGTVVLSLANSGHCEHNDVLVEKVAEGYLEIYGEVVLQGTAAGLAGSLRGGLFLMDGPQCLGTSVASRGACESSSHRVILTR